MFLLLNNKLKAVYHICLFHEQERQPHCTDEEFNIDEAVPANRGLWVSVVYSGRLIYQSRDFKKRQGRSTSLLIHPF
jgi:hypothetical protein